MTLNYLGYISLVIQDKIPYFVAMIAFAGGN